jgi:hypothetical protein
VPSTVRDETHATNVCQRDRRIRSRELFSEGNRVAPTLLAIDTDNTALEHGLTPVARATTVHTPDSRTIRACPRLPACFLPIPFNEAIHAAGAVEVHVIPARRPPKLLEPSTLRQPPPPRRARLPVRRRALAWLLAVLAPAVVGLGLLPLRSSLGVASELFCMLLPVVLVAVIGGVRPVVLATVSGLLMADFLYARPYYSLRVTQLVDFIALVTFAVVAVVIGVWSTS